MTSNTHTPPLFQLAFSVIDLKRTEAWFHNGLGFLPAGGNDPADPTQAGWGGRFRRTPDGWYRDLPFQDGFDPRTTISQWRPAFQAEFAKRMQWCVE